MKEQFKGRGKSLLSVKARREIEELVHSNERIETVSEVLFNNIFLKTCCFSETRSGRCQGFIRKESQFVASKG